MSDTKPLVSVITPTWVRPVALRRAIDSVRAQTYRPVEHIVISDGPDPTFAITMDNPAYSDVRFAMLETKSPYRWGHLCRLMGIEMAKGEFIAYLDDDNAWRPQHLELIVAQIIASGAGFGYGKSMFRDRGTDYELGCPPPMLGQIDTSMIVHRTEILEYATWRDEGPKQQTVEWDLVERWLQASVGWTWVQEITVDNYQTRA
jgi:glycosyltransferase involved in cell wall biosynthesis